MILTDKINECDGACSCAGGCDCSGAGAGMTTGSVLGGCDHSSGQGYMGAGCFHVPFPAMPMLSRYGWPAGKTKKKKKYKNGLNYDNPYVGKIKTIVGENEPFVVNDEHYLGSAKKEFEMVVAEQNPIYSGVLYFNRDLSLAWLVQKNGILVMFKPIPDSHGRFTIYKTYLHSTGNIALIDKIGSYGTENEALTEIWHMSQKHQDLLMEFLDESRFSPHDIMNWEAHGHDPRFAPQPRKPSVNTKALESELKRRFPNQFIDVSLSDRRVPGRWTIEFKVNQLPNMAQKLTGQQRIKTVIPMIDRILAFLRMRYVEINQYDVSAVLV